MMRFSLALLLLVLAATPDKVGQYSTGLSLFPYRLSTPLKPL